MTDEQLKELVERMDRLEGDHGFLALILCEEAASAIRQLMSEREEAVGLLKRFECECASRCEVFDYLPPNSDTCRYGKARAFLSKHPPAQS